MAAAAQFLYAARPQWQGRDNGPGELLLQHQGLLNEPPRFNTSMTEVCMYFRFLPIAAIACAVAMTACTANPQSSATIQPARSTTTHLERFPASANLAHGPELESGSTFMVSEGNNHAAFPASATFTRTANGIVVTYNGVTRTFSSNARIDFGTYHRYAKAQSQ
jgi:hypothetical protein